MSPDVDALHGTPIFDEVDKWARRSAAAAPTMLSFAGTPIAPALGTARTVRALLAAAREERAPRHALRRS